MKKTNLLLLLALLLPVTAIAIPILQVGAIDSTYMLSSTNPTESDTAITTSNTILVGGVNNHYLGSLGGGMWSNFGWAGKTNFPIEFDGHGAILVASVPNNTSGILMVNGNLPFMTSTTSMFPNKHDPVKDDISDFRYFDIGNFNYNELITNFTGEEGIAFGEIKELLISATGLPWVHFDVMAIQNKFTQHGLLTNLINSPGSHDVTWLNHTETVHGVPTPSTHLLFVLGLILMSLGGVINKLQPMVIKRK